MSETAGNHFEIAVRSLHSHRFRRLVPYLLLAPTLILQASFFVYPVLRTVWLSLTDLYLLASPVPTFVGLENFQKLLRDEVFHRAVVQSVYWVAGSNSAHILIGLSFALLMNRKFKLRGLWRGLFLVPWVVPAAAFGILWQWLYNMQWGLINLTLLEWGIVREPIDWLGAKNVVWFSVILANGWKNFGFMYICFLSGLQTIPVELYEAAQIDGASSWQRFIHVTISGLRPVLTVVVLLGAVWTFNDFDVIWLLTKAGPGYDTVTYGPLVYLQGFKFFRFGYASAIGIVGFVFVMVVTVFYVRRMKIE